MIHAWARVISATNWGYLNQKGFPNRAHPTLSVQCKRNFILLSIMRAFSSYGGCQKFLIPPTNEIPTADVGEMCNYYTFTFSSGLRPPPVRRGRITPAYYPGWTPEEVKAKLDHNSRANNPNVTQKIQQNNGPKTVSFANAVKSKTPTTPNPTKAFKPAPGKILDWSQVQDNNIATDFSAEEFFEDRYGSLNPAAPTNRNPTRVAAATSPHQVTKPSPPHQS